MTNIARAAEFLAQQWPCFPCNLQKRPVTRHGLKDASQELHDIRRMFRELNADMIGVPTGAASGFVVVDLDVKEGASGLEWLAANEHRLPQTRRHRTRSGGLHLLFNVPASRAIRNSASKLAPGVDVRGEGGYVIVPPSPGYEIADDTMPADMPAWLLDAIDPPAPPRAALPAPAPREHSGGGTRYGMSALDDECQAIMGAGFGSQEHTLNAAALKVGSLVAGGELDRGYAMSALMSAAMGMPSQAGRPAWSSEEIRRKIERGMADGMATPRQAPPREVRHTIRVEIVPPEPPPYDAPPPHWEAEPEVEIMEPAPAARAAAAGAVEVLQLLDPTTWTTPPPPRRWIVEGWVPVGVVSAKYGDGGIGKTLSAQQLMTSVALGAEWMGLPTAHGRTLGVFCEDDADELHRRQLAINAAMGATMQDLGQMRLLSRLGDDNSLVHYDATGSYLTAFHAQLMAACADWRPDLVVLDTAADLYPDNENDRSKVRWFIQAGLARIARDFGCAVLLLAHPSASGLASGSGTGGSTAWNNTVRSRIYLAKEEGEDANPNVRIMSKKKSNYGAQGGDIRLIWQDGVLVPMGAGNAASPVPWETISEIFKQIEQAWEAGRPWANTWQAKSVGRYLPTWVKFKFGIPEKTAAKMIEAWQVNGCLVTEVFNTSTKATGLKVVRRPDR